MLVIGICLLFYVFTIIIMNYDGPELGSYLLIISISLLKSNESSLIIYYVR